MSVDHETDAPHRDYERVAEAIAYLKNNYTAQPDLEAVSAHLGLSPFHFQRLFSRWAGVSPKKFIQHLSLVAAKQSLDDASDVLTASLDAGLTGPGRLHDLFVSIEALSPGEYKRRGDGLQLRHGCHPTRFGPALVVISDRGLCGLEFLDEAASPAFQASLVAARWPKAQPLFAPAETLRWSEQALGAFAGESATPLPLVLAGSPFQLQVWQALLRIPPGKTASYRAIAAAIGKANASRAVGSAIGANPIAALIPCHRVLQANGALGGYRWGTTRKEALLAWERARSASDC